MEGSSSKSSFMNRLKDATSTVASNVREGVEDLQLRHELSQAYGELGRLTVGLVESGAVTHPELAAPVEKIGELKAQLEATPAEPATSTEPAQS